jgi:hypothetical protein
MLAKPPNALQPAAGHALTACWTFPAGFTLPYPPQKFAAEFVVQWLFLIVEPTRLFLGELLKCKLDKAQGMPAMQLCCADAAG